ncbi:uncharacterized protein [Labrus bergylta]|uniref:Uncharacterized LOC109976634 n=1 Tax=Labrus bergylta TaxID=56723 RepID=A0A3Q3GDX1_9LABR|nr:uncharacterized protein LOC109976634 [Labrus bergylta]XP_020486875.1 uncharacterized protein LOC109982137 [Labrus bergylta]
MSQYCIIQGCKSRRARECDSMVTFHCFPTDKDLQEEWLKKTRKDRKPDFKVTSNTRVCSKHFAGDCFWWNERIRRTCLIPGSVPHIFPWNKVSYLTIPLTNQKGEAAGNVTIEVTESTEEEADLQPEIVVTSAPYADHDYIHLSPPLEEQLMAARQEISRLTEEKKMLLESRFCLQRFQDDARLLYFYTGFQDYGTLNSVYLSLEPTAERLQRWSQAQTVTGQEMSRAALQAENLSLIDQFFLFLCRVREGASEESLAERFHVSPSTVSRVVTTWANYLFFMLGSLPVWLHRSAVSEMMPQCFKDTYPRTRVILDCTEVHMERASSKKVNPENYSNYNGSTTLKGLMGVSPSGEITFVSSLYEGSISAEEITKRSGILSLLEEGDEVMADNSFLISDLLSAINVSLVSPPFLNQRRKSIKQEASTTQSNAKLRIHVEKAKQRMKQNRIFNRVLPHSHLGTVNQLWYVCAMLANFQVPLS